MKKSVSQTKPGTIQMKLFITILFIVVGHFINAQSPVEGSWSFDFSASLETSLSKSRYDSLPALNKLRIAERFDSRILKFHQEGRLEVSWTESSGVKTLEGSFTFNESTNELVISISGKENRFRVSVVNASTLMLEDSTTTGLFQKIILNKNS